MRDSDIDEVIARVKEKVAEWKPALVDGKSDSKEWNPYHVLIGTILSLRTKDTVTAEASDRLFALADTPEEMVKLAPEKIAETIYPVGFYNNKSKNIVEISQILLDKYNGDVPNDLDKLLDLPGVGRKTANLVLTAGFDELAICVDIHVHRISNRWGYVQTDSPDETEFALRDKLPQKYWKIYNGLLVTFGQNLCTPVSPWCSQCPVRDYCEQNGVERTR